MTTTAVPEQTTDRELVPTFEAAEELIHNGTATIKRGRLMMGMGFRAVRDHRCT